MMILGNLTQKLKLTLPIQDIIEFCFRRVSNIFVNRTFSF